MKRTIAVLLLSALSAGVGWSLFAQGPPAPGAGKVLILNNERAFEGDIEKVGELYRVRKGTSETAIPADQALHLCADWDAALAFMRARANLGDPDERLRLAEWCQVNHQIERARVEAKAALDMRPKHAETRRLLKMLELTSTAKARHPSGAAPAPAPVLQIDLSFESVTAFSQRVQPILMNTCITCHSGSYPGKFRLYRLHEGGERVATQRNLAAVMAQLNLEKPAASPLLIRAVNVHGNAKAPPIAGRQAPTFYTLCVWIDQTLADNPHLFEQPGTKAAANARPLSLADAPVVSAPRVPPVAATTPPKELPPLPGVAAAQAAPTADGSPPRPILPAPPTAPAPQAAGPLDEFSAAHFNRLAHPDKK